MGQNRTANQVRKRLENRDLEDVNTRNPLPVQDFVAAPSRRHDHVEIGIPFEAFRSRYMLKDSDSSGDERAFNLADQE